MVFATLQSHFRRFVVRARFSWHHYRKRRREQRQLAVDLGELNPWTIPEAEQQERDNTGSRVLRVSRRRM